MALAARGEFRLLGPTELRVGEDTVTLGAPKQRAMLAVLLLNAGDVVSLDTLAKDPRAAA